MEDEVGIFFIEMSSLLLVIQVKFNDIEYRYILERKLCEWQRKCMRV